MLNLVLPQDVETRLREQAMRSGIGAAEYASRLIEEHLPAEARADNEQHEQRHRGTTPIELARQQLFTQPVTIPFDALPRWKPHITLTRRVLAESDHV